MCVESLDMEINYYLQSSHGGKSPSGCLPLPCSHHGGPNKGWGLGAWGSWRILGLLQTNSWDLWGRNSHCCVKISTKGWNDYLHKKRESNDVCTNQNFHSILIFVPNVWGVDSKYRNTAVVFTPFGRCLRVNWESSNTARKEKRKKPKEKRSTRKKIRYDHAAPQVWKKHEMWLKMFNYILTWNKSIYHHLRIMVSPIAKVTSGKSSVDIFTHQGHISQLVS